ncbi:Septum formation protein Maf [Defluviimonas aquaemixtae]|uniref:Nucleoside triphosphate pyrophosphatase n=1 Tax=Albidovulum aquaemixtae TaxID=1542388 RepID=A0A2R8BJG2_9RHOB|nr:Maf family protein [Defluviimonas aquaemixtae]SPH23545.1 Septum formation protein Maf [Defluviimonas aquaemixtae]
MTENIAPRIVLASGSEVRAAMLRNAGLEPDLRPARIDEETIRHALVSEGAGAHDIADALAEAKAIKVSQKEPSTLVIGADQILDCDGAIFTKPADPEDARTQLAALRGRTHRLLSAAVVAIDGRPLWRHVGQAQLTMRALSDEYISDYVARNWKSIRHTVGCYQLEAEGVRLFSRIDGDYFTVLGLPLIELLTWLAIRGDIAT